MNSYESGQTGPTVVGDRLSESLPDAERRAGARSWWGAALAVAAVGWGANQFAPLLLMYQAGCTCPRRPSQATFGLYALGLIPGLLLGGPVSDRFGRRRVMVPALVDSVLGSPADAQAAGVGWLFAGG